LDEFVSFVERIRTFGLIPTSFTGESKPSIIYLIDDLPMMHSKAALGRLKDCLNLLVHTTQIPTAILVTDYGNTDSADYNARSVEELKTSLESSGACKVTTFNNSRGFRFHVIVEYLCRT